MCVIVYRPEGKHVKTRYLKNAWEANDDGAGIMFAHNKTVHVMKGLMTFKDFIEAWRAIPETLPTVAHFRIGTHGSVGPDNTHPFEITTGRLALVHNGILPIEPEKEKDWSDTATFVELVLKKLPWGWHKNPAMLHLVENYCGSYNKLAMLDETGKVTLVNEAAGTWEQGVWFSNHSFRGTAYPRRGFGYYPGATTESWGWDGDEWIDKNAGNTAFQPPRDHTPTWPVGGADKESTSFHDSLLESSARESGLRRESCQARSAGEELEADKLESAANAVRDERINAIRDNAKANGGRFMIARPYGGD